MVTDEILDKYIVVIPKAKTAIISVYSKEFEDTHPSDLRHNIVLSLKESISYVREQKREMYYDVDEKDSIIKEFLDENEMLHS